VVKTHQATWLLGVYRISVLDTVGYRTKLEEIICFSNIFYEGLDFLYLRSTALDKTTWSIDCQLVYLQKSKNTY